ncbi:hypothetical protein ACR9YC_11125 [Parasphingorhabdus sp. DH2-15]|uniref:hypothetical protein n=1 Tax=Parasphingorhabdus sp. DH2-15 TaxID=3444112 RepID=UPI003F68657E
MNKIILAITGSLATLALAPSASAATQMAVAPTQASVFSIAVDTGATTISDKAELRGRRGFRGRGFRGRSFRGRGFKRGFRSRGFRSRGFRNRGFRGKSFRHRGFRKGFKGNFHHHGFRSGFNNGFHHRDFHHDDFHDKRFQHGVNVKGNFKHKGF